MIEGTDMRAEFGTPHTALLQHGTERLHRRFPRWLQSSFWLCIAIAVGAVLLRSFAMFHPANAPRDLAQLDAAFRSHAALTWTHILCALAFVSLLPFLFWRRTQNSRLLLHAFLAIGLIVGLTAYAMTVTAIGGWTERSAVLFFNTLFLVSLARVLINYRRGNTLDMRRGTIRAVAIVLGIAATRPVMGVFFATSALTHLTPRQFFGIAFWIGFSLTTITVELWLRRTRFAGGSTQ